MSDPDTFDDTPDEDMEEDISALEDNPAEEGEGADVIAGAGEELLPAGVPLYRLRLSYSNETFLAAFQGEPLRTGGMVLVPTRYGRDLAQVTGPVRRNGASPPAEVVRIERPASPEDLEKADHNRREEEEALRICRRKIEAHRLEMKLVSVHYLLEEPKLLFFFTSESRVDFRELVKDLVGIFKIRIELRQIGVRDESRVIGGLGICGRCYCCHAVSDKLKPVSIKMAKDQNLSLNSMKISGPCGRLLCCLAYEHLFYGEQRRLLPSEGARITHEGVSWRVQEVNVVLGQVKLSAEDDRFLQLPASAFEKAEGRWQIREKPLVRANSEKAGTEDEAEQTGPGSLAPGKR
jgi:cell fate regulator YaaT (PSP1 superfamily)